MVKILWPARLGGDEFVILLDELNTVEGAAVIADKIIDKTNHAVQIEDLSLQVGCSIGISIFAEDATDSKSILHCADVAMYAAKTAGRNGYFYCNSRNKH